jgi:ABC-2 type transport system permease protein
MKNTVALVRIEWFKLRTTPALAVSFACTLGLVMVAAATNVFLAGQQGLADLGTPDNVGKVFAVGAVTSTVMLVIGIVIGAGEHRDRTMVGTLLAEPRRGRIVAAKLVTSGAVGAAVGASVFASTYAVAVALFAIRGVHTLPIDVTGLALGTVLVTACYAVLGVALGTLTRNLMTAIVAGLIWVTVIELAILQPLVPSLAKWLPTGAAVALTTVRHTGDQLLAPGAAALVLLGWALAVCIVAMRTSVRREVR